MNYLLVNLALADIVFGVFLTPKFILNRTFTHPDGKPGKILCKFLTGLTLAWFGGVSSAFTLVAIAIERFYAVMYPLGNRGNLTKRKLKVSIDALVIHFLYLIVSWKKQRILSSVMFGLLLLYCLCCW